MYPNRLRPLNKRKVLSKPKFKRIDFGLLRGTREFTIVATKDAKIGDSQVINGVKYVLRSEPQLRKLIRNNRWSDVEQTCTSRITNFDRLFFEKRGFNGKIGHWDTSSVRSMKSTFHGAKAFNQPIRVWDTSRVKSMNQMFKFATSFHQQIWSWDTSSVTDMGEMFYHAESFNFYIGGWNTGRVKHMNAMFQGCKKFNQPIGYWDVRQVLAMAEMFAYTRAFNQPLRAWNLRSVENMEFMFYGAKAFDQDLSSWRYLVSTPGRVAFIDAETRLRILGLNMAKVRAFKRGKYKLHDEVNGIDYIIGLNTKIPLNDARVIAGDTHSGKLRHIWHKNALEGMIAHHPGPVLKHPLTGQPYTREYVVPLRDVLHQNDVNVYAQLRNGRTVRETRRNRSR